MKTRFFVCLLMAGVLVWGCSSNSSPPGPEPVRELTADEVAVVQSQTTFGWNLFRTIVSQEPDTNCFISPLSVSMALGMTYNGSNGDTREAMEDVLAVQGLSPEQINQAYRGLIDVLESLDPQVTMEIANSIWYRRGFTVKSTFQALCSKYFDAAIKDLDFEDPNSVDVINSWVNDNTRGKIPKILDLIKPSDVMFLIDAIYFKAQWTYRFDPESTSPGPFHVSDGETMTCNFMHQHATYPYGHGDHFEAIKLDYGNRQFAMIVLLPTEGYTADQVLEGMDDAHWNAMLASFFGAELDLVMPKFKQEYTIKLNDALTAMGMGIAFSRSEADFSGISENQQLFIDNVMHKTFVQVDEEGTEAAAVTSVTIGTTALPPVSFVVNRPFVFVITDEHTHAIAFVGKIVRPNL